MCQRRIGAHCGHLELLGETNAASLLHTHKRGSRWLQPIAVQPVETRRGKGRHPRPLPKELGVRFIAYSPLEKGLLTGKYSMENPPPGLRGENRIGMSSKTAAGPASPARNCSKPRQDHCAGSPELGHLQRRHADPGAKNAEQAEENPGGAGWRMTDDEIAKLDEITDQFFQGRRGSNP